MSAGGELSASTDGIMDFDALRGAFDEARLAGEDGQGGGDGTAVLYDTFYRYCLLQIVASLYL